ncbi:toll/interleukin-1 receptor domain-containing protein [Piscinibacter sp.]|uniref:toll/interleukin-1 receptor domain-containing protein n=1 Tax=Piscinibacter sp. TaxID=1903157 RepID=UPI002BA19336|nr:toll/interleukin-1 receptor domain-containing protein [Albitalea sp.]HUG24458.1 toll/interleukin-1 receptor domain-containing protein [Albitalea sp.]
MKLFLSYPSGHRELAERLTLALEAEGHEVFMDRADLKAGESFHQALREAILGADAMVSLVTPEAVAAGSYALAELNIAQQRWRRPSGHVLPVMVVATPIAALPSYAMRWMREMYATRGKTTFAEQVAQAQPVLLQGLPRTGGPRAADLRSHIGWGEYLRGREGAAGADPVAYWRRALADDAHNVYANAMWARQMLHRGGRFDEVKTLFAKAEASGRDRPFVRALQFGGTLGGNIETSRYAVVVADQMRRGGETIEQHHRDALWTGALGAPPIHADARATLFTALPPAQLLETFDWLYPDAEVSDERRMQWRFARATLLTNNGDRVAARAGFESLVADLRAAN